MKTAFKKSFLKEIKLIRNKRLKEAIADCICEVEKAQMIAEIKNLKKLIGYSVYYRIRVGDYRIGIKVENEVVYFVVLEHRKDIYKRFP
jgi:mRNA interferase RelE/StbE